MYTMDLIERLKASEIQQRRTRDWERGGNVLTPDAVAVLTVTFCTDCSSVLTNWK
jgi:hypothetical protein